MNASLGAKYRMDGTAWDCTDTSGASVFTATNVIPAGIDTLPHDYTNTVTVSAPLKAPYIDGTVLSCIATDSSAQKNKSAVTQLVTTPVQLAAPSVSTAGNQVTIKGSGSPGSAIQVFKDGNLITTPTVTIDIDGSYTVTFINPDPSTPWDATVQAINTTTSGSPSSTSTMYPQTLAQQKVQVGVAPLPVATADNYSVPANKPFTVAAPGVLANDNPQGGTATLGAGPSNGTLALDPNGSFVYTPTTGYSGADSFTYTVKAIDGTSAPVTVSLIIIPPGVPVGVADNYSTPLNIPLTIASPGVLVNDSGPTDASLSASLATATTHGTVILNRDGSFVYTPTTGFSGVDNFTYLVSYDNSKSAQARTAVSTKAAPIIDSGPVNVTITVPSAASSPTPVPTLGQIGLLLLSGLMGGVAVLRCRVFMRRRLAKPAL